MFHSKSGQSDRLKIVKNARDRLFLNSNGWRKKENLRRWMILLKLIYSILFLSLTIYSSLNESCEENIQYSNNNFIEIFDHWYSFVTVILLLSLFLDRLKRENFCSVQLFKAIDIVLLITFLLLVVIGHIEGYYRLCCSPLTGLRYSTFASIVFLDLCPITIAVLIIIRSIEKRRFRHCIHVESLISNV